MPKDIFGQEIAEGEALILQAPENPDEPFASIEEANEFIQKRIRGIQNQNTSDEIRSFGESRFDPNANLNPQTTKVNPQTNVPINSRVTSPTSSIRPEQFSAAEIEARREDAPVFFNLSERDRDFLSKSFDDIDNATFLERSKNYVVDLKEASQKTLINFQISAALTESFLTGKEPDADTILRITELSEKVQAIEVEQRSFFLGAPLDAPSAATEMLPFVIGAILSGVAGSKTLGAAGMVIGAPFGPQASATLGAAGATIGGFAGVFAFSANLEGTLMLADMLQTEDEDGNKLDFETALNAARLGALLIAATETFAFGKFTRLLRIPGTKSFQIRSSISKMMKNPTSRRRLNEAFKDYGGALAAETGQETIQEFIGVVVEEYTRYADPDSFVDFTQDDFADAVFSQETFRRSVQAGRTAFLATSLFGAPRIGSASTKHLLADREALESQPSDQTMVRRLATLAGNPRNTSEEQTEVSKLLQRDPELYSQYTAEALAKSDIENVRIPGEKLATFLESSEGRDALFLFEDATPEFQDQLAQAVAVGGDVLIPTGEFVTKIAGTKFFASIENDIRIREGGMTANEVKEIDQSDFEARAEEIFQVENAAAVLESELAELEDAAVKEFVAARAESGESVTDDQARKHVSLATAMTRAWALELGVTPKEAALYLPESIVGPLNPKAAEAREVNRKQFLKERILKQGSTVRGTPVHRAVATAIANDFPLNANFPALPSSIARFLEARNNNPEALQELKQIRKDLFLLERHRDLVRSQAGEELKIEERTSTSEELQRRNEAFKFLDEFGFGDEAEFSSLSDKMIDRLQEKLTELGDLGSFRGDGPKFLLQSTLDFFSGTSKLLKNKDGSPKQLFHSTAEPGGISEFRPLTHFGTAKAANRRGIEKRAFREASKVSSSTVPVFLNIKNPARIEDNGLQNTTSILTALEDAGIITEQENRDVHDKGSSAFKEAGKGARNVKEQEIKEESALESSKVNSLIKLLESKGFDGIVYKNKVEDRGKDSFIIFHPEQVKSVFNQSPTTEDAKILLQSVELRERNRSRTLERLGLDPLKPHNVREIGAGIEQDQRSRHGVIKKGDFSVESEKKLAKWMVEEILFELEGGMEGTAIGWYNEKFQRALDVIGENVFPELLTNQDARDIYTLILAISSNGTEVSDSMRFASTVYSAYRKDGVMLGSEIDRSTLRAEVAPSLRRIDLLIKKKGGISQVRDYLMATGTVSNLNKVARKEGSGRQIRGRLSNETVPTAVLEFGPKIGIFYSNLMGDTQFLTIDRWFVRMFNRLRGRVLPNVVGLASNPTRHGKKVGLARFKELILRDDITDEEAFLYVIEHGSAYRGRGSQDGTDVERAANTIFKSAFVNLKDVPDNGSDAAFMARAVIRATKSIRRKGHDFKVSDVQAILWYYEKSLYGELGARTKGVEGISYEESAKDYVQNIERAPLDDDDRTFFEGPDGNLIEKKDNDEFDWATGNLYLPQEQMDKETVTWEGIQSTKLPHAIHNAPDSVKKAFTTEAAALLYTEEGVNVLEQILGVKVLYDYQSTGMYDKNNNPNIVTDIQNEDALRAVKIYSRVVQYIYKQDAAPWYKLIEDLSRIDLPTGLRLTFFKSISQEVENGMRDEMIKLLGDGAGWTKINDRQIDIINYRDENGDSSLKLTDEEFTEKIVAFATGESGTRLGVVPETDIYKVEGEYPWHDWEGEPDGQSILKQISELETNPTRFAAIERRSKDRRRAFESLLDRYSEDKWVEREAEIRARRAAADERRKRGELEKRRFNFLLQIKTPPPPGSSAPYRDSSGERFPFETSVVVQFSDGRSEIVKAKGLDANHAIQRERERHDPDTIDGIEGIPESTKFIKRRLPKTQEVDILLEKGTPPDPRGFFDIQDRVLGMLKSADHSTFPHELAHAWLFGLSSIIKSGKATPQMQNDMKIILEWLGATSFDEVTRDMHEQFADGFLAFMAEGVAPSVELENIFSQFRVWIEAVFTKALELNKDFQRVEISDIMREVYGRMVVTTSEVNADVQDRNFFPMWKTAEEAGMTSFEFEDYVKGFSTSIEQAKQRMDQETVRKANRRKKRFFKSRRARIRREVEAELVDSPTMVAKRRLRDEPDLKIELGALEQEFDTPKGRKLVSKFRQSFAGVSVVSTDGTGMSPSQMAEELGFSSAEHMMVRLSDVQNIRTEVIEQEVNRRLSEDPTFDEDDKSTPEAQEALYGDRHENTLLAELSALNRASGTGRRPATAAVMKQVAQRIIDGKKVGEIVQGDFIRNERQAGTAAFRALERGDILEASEQKQRQLIAQYLVRAARDAVKERGVIERRIRRLSKKSIRKNIDGEYLAQIDEMMGQFDMRASVSLEEARSREVAIQSLPDFVAEKQASEGAPFRLDTDVLKIRASFKTLTMTQFRALDKNLSNLKKLGNEANEVRVGAFKMKVEQAAVIIEETLSENLPAKSIIVESKSKLSQFRNMVRSVLAIQRKIASLMFLADGSKAGGDMWSIFIRPFNDAANEKLVLEKESTERLAEIFKRYEAKDLTAPVWIESTGRSWRKETILAFMLNQGTENNQQRLSEFKINADQTLTKEMLEEMKDTVTREDWDFVEEVWAYLDSWWPKIVEIEYRMTGVIPEKVEGIPVKTKFGEIQGSYYPISYDRMKSSQSLAEQLSGADLDMSRGIHSVAQTKKGHLELRKQTGGGRELRQDLGVITDHLAQVIHDITHREAVVVASRVLRNREAHSAMDKHFGVQQTDEIRQWIERIALGDVPPRNVLENWLNHLRSGVSVSAMGWKWSTGLMQILGLTQTIVRIGPKATAIGLKQYMGAIDYASTGDNPLDFSLNRLQRQVHAISPFMENRAVTMNRDVKFVYKQLANNRKLTRMTASYWFLLQKFQQGVDMPTWLGAFNEATRTLGISPIVPTVQTLNEEMGDLTRKAIAIADQAVIDSQSSGFIKDLAGVETGGPLRKLFTTFYSYFSSTYNLSVNSITKSGIDLRKGDPLAAAKVMSDMMLIWFVPMVLGELMMSRGPDDEDEWLAWLAREQMLYLAGGSVFTRDLGQAIFSEYNYTSPAGLRGINVIGKGLRSGVELTENFFTDEISEEQIGRFARDTVSAAGILLHFPSGQTLVTIDGIIAISKGEPETSFQAGKGLFLRPPREN